MKFYSWDDLYERADGSACGDPELKAKDNARWQIGMFIQEHEGIDIEDTSAYESAEDTLEWYLEKHPMFFDIDGNLLDCNGNRIY